MGFREIQAAISQKIKEKSAEYKEAQAISEARDDWETTDKALRNQRRQARKYIDQDEKACLKTFLWYSFYPLRIPEFKR